MSDLFIHQELRKRILLHGHVDAAISIGSNPPGGEYDEDDEQQQQESDEDKNNRSDGNQYEYLDEDHLQFEFGACRETQDITKVFTVRLCAYDIRISDRDDEADNVPFLLHLMQFDGQKFDYPQF